jgi:hypothetical protein
MQGNGKGGERLRPGQLDGLLLGYMKKHKAELPLSPSAVAQGISRSSGAVGNCLGRLEQPARRPGCDERGSQLVDHGLAVLRTPSRASRRARARSAAGQCGLIRELRLIEDGEEARDIDRENASQSVESAKLTRRHQRSSPSAAAGVVKTPPTPVDGGWNGRLELNLDL